MKVARVMTVLCDPEVFSSIQFLEGQLAAICTKFKNVRGWHQTSEFNVGGYKSSSRMGSHAKLFETTPVWCLPSPLLHTNSCCPDLFHMTFGRTERFWSLLCFRADPGLTWAGMARVQNDFLWLPVLVNFFISDSCHKPQCDSSCKMEQTKQLFSKTGKTGDLCHATGLAARHCATVLWDSFFRRAYELGWAKGRQAAAEGAAERRQLGRVAAIGVFSDHRCHGETLDV